MNRTRLSSAVQFASDASGNVRGLSGAGGVVYPLTTPSAGVRAAIIGDSIGENCTSAETNDIRSWVHWGIAFHGGDLIVEPSNNYAVAATTSTQALATVPSVISAGVSVCFVCTGVNDPGNSITLATSLSNIKQICSKLLGAGIVPIVRLISPRSNASWGAISTGRQQSSALNEEVKAYYGNPGSGVFVFDPNPYYIDQTSATSDPRAALVTDGLHPNGVGAALEGAALASVITQVGIPVRRISAWGPGGAYDTTNNKRGNLLNDGSGLDYGALSGTSGTVNGQGGAVASGITSGGAVVATGWDISQISGSALGATASIESTAISVGGVATGATYRRQVISFTAAGGEKINVRCSYGVGANRTFATGDVTYAEVECEVTAATTAIGISYAALIATEGGTSRQVVGLSNSQTFTDLLPVTNRGVFVIRAPAQTVLNGASVVGYTFDLQFQAATSGAMAFKIGQPRLIRSSAFTLSSL